MSRLIAAATLIVILTLSAITSADKPPHVTRPVAAPALPLISNPAANAPGSNLEGLELVVERIVHYVHVEEVARAEAEAAVIAQRESSQRSNRPADNRPTSPGDHSDTLACIRAHESDTAGGYSAQNPTSTASGAYQALDTTWDGYAGYPTAADAPPEVQDTWAREAIAAAGTRPWAGSGC